MGGAAGAAGATGAAGAASPCDTGLATPATKLPADDNAPNGGKIDTAEHCAATRDFHKEAGKRSACAMKKAEAEAHEHEKAAATAKASCAQTAGKFAEMTNK